MGFQCTGVVVSGIEVPICGSGTCSQSLRSARAGEETSSLLLEPLQDFAVISLGILFAFVIRTLKELLVQFAIMGLRGLQFL